MKEQGNFLRAIIYESKLILNIWKYEQVAMNDLKQKIDKVVLRQPSRWMEKALWDEANEAWLDRSANIALRILGTLQNRSISQKELAEKIGVSPQQVSKILRGNENLTLETIAKLEAALGVVLFVIPESAADSETGTSNKREQKKSASRKREAVTPQNSALTIAQQQHSTPT